MQYAYVYCNDAEVVSSWASQIWVKWDSVVCQMQVCPAYHDQAVIRFIFYEYSTLLHITPLLILHMMKLVNYDIAQ